jgi:hypothetical protein
MTVLLQLSEYPLLRRLRHCLHKALAFLAAGLLSAATIQ